MSGYCIPDGITTITCPTSEQEVTVRIVEVKNEIGDGDSNPIVQAECGIFLPITWPSSF